MSQPLFRLVALVPALMIAGCETGQSRQLESVHQPVVSRASYSFDVATDGRGLAPGESQRLAGWLRSLRVGYGDRVAIDDPSATGGERAEVAAIVAQFGLIVSDDAPITGAPVAPGTARVVITRMKAEVPGCPDFSTAGMPNFDAHTSSNHGCAVNSNLAAMVANPADLVLGQADADGTSDPSSTYKAVGTYRSARPTGADGLKSEKTGAK